jgi:hypothetical protein
MDPFEENTIRGAAGLPPSYIISGCYGLSGLTGRATGAILCSPNPGSLRVARGVTTIGQVREPLILSERR